MIGEEYGTRPHKVLGMKRTTAMERFWTDAAVRHATVQFKNDRMDEQDPNSAGAASPRQKEELQESQESRAKRREAMEQAGMSAPSPDAQLTALDELEQKRENADIPAALSTDE